MTMDITANSHRTLDSLYIGLVDEDFPCLRVMQRRDGKRSARVIVLLVRCSAEKATHLVTEPLDVELSQLLAVREMSDPCTRAEKVERGSANC